MTPADKLKATSVALIHMERARDQAAQEEALYRDQPGYEAEYLLASRIVTLIEADLREIERVIAKYTKEAPMLSVYDGGLIPNPFIPEEAA